MNFSKMKAPIFFTILFLVFLKTSLGRPSVQQSTQKVPKFLTHLYEKLSKGLVTLKQRVTAVHGIYASVKQLRGAAKKGTDVELWANFNGIPSVKKTIQTDLHLHIESRANTTRLNVTQAVCKLYINDVKTNKLIASKIISCDQSSKQVVPLTSFVNKWLKQSPTNFGIRVKISTNTANIPKSLLPFINSSKQTEQPYYILYT